MTTYNTGNPVGSPAPKDLYDNAENLDTAIHTGEKTWVDRLGNTRTSWAGATGYQILGDYAGGIEITERNQIVREGGEYWRLKGSVDLPYTTTGTWVGDDEDRFVSVGDAVLRQDLAAEGGVFLVKDAVASVANVTDLRALTGLVDAQVIELVAYRDGWAATAAGPKGGGTFTVDLSDSTTADDGGFVFVTADGVRVKRNDTKFPTPEMFGAYADGANEDFSFIQSAVNALKDLIEDPPTGSTGTAVAGATLWFGQAKYLVTTKILIDDATGARRINLRGNKSIMVGDGTDDCFYYDGTYRSTVSGFEFQNFVTDISFDTNNISGATFTVDDCAAFNSQTFIDSRGYADSRSTVLNVNGCFGDRTVVKHIKSTTDVLNVNGGNFQHGNPGGSAFDIDSRANFSGTLFVPNSDAAVASSRWVDMLATADTSRWITFDKCRISGEFGGVTPVYCFAQGNDGNQVNIGVSFMGGYAACGAGGPGNDGGLVILANNGDNTASVTPNRIALSDLNVSTFASTKLIRTESGLPLDVPTSVGFTVQIDEVTRNNVIAVDPARLLDDLVKPYLVTESRRGHQNIVQTGNINLDASLGDVINIQASSAATIKTINFPYVRGGDRITICNQASTTNVTIEDNSTAGNGIYVGGADLVIPAFSAVTLVFTALNDRWLKVG